MDKIINVLIDSLEDDPLVNYIVLKKKGNNKKRLLSYWAVTLKAGMLYANTKIMSDNSGIIIWKNPGTPKLGYRERWKAGMLQLPFKLGIKSSLRAAIVDYYQNMAEKKAVSGRYSHLLLIAVDPSKHQSGIAGELMEHYLSQPEIASLPCYTETVSKKVVAVGKHFGFEVVLETKMPGKCPPIWSMVRAPQQL